MCLFFPSSKLKKEIMVETIKYQCNLAIQDSVYAPTLIVNSEKIK